MRRTPPPIAAPAARPPGRRGRGVRVRACVRDGGEGAGGGRGGGTGRWLLRESRRLKGPVEAGYWKQSIGKQSNGFEPLLDSAAVPRSKHAPARPACAVERPPPSPPRPQVPRAPSGARAPRAARAVPIPGASARVRRARGARITTAGLTPVTVTTMSR